jgi:hypothetical protein
MHGGPALRAVAEPARAKGVTIGMKAAEAARLMLG